MKRHIENINRRCELYTDLPDENADAPAVEAWLEQHAWDGANWLLAHTVEGVVWGKLCSNNGQRVLLTSTGRFDRGSTGRLRAREIESCRLFGSDGELLLWRAGEALHARRYLDEPATAVSAPPVDSAHLHACDGALTAWRYLDELQVLWGTDIVALDKEGGFTLIADGVEGLYHAVPLLRRRIPVDPERAAAKQRPLRLHVRHYVAEDENGALFIAGSRLVGLGVETLGGSYQPVEALGPEPAEEAEQEE